MASRPHIVISGIGVVAPGGVGSEAFWDAICAGRSAIGELSEVPPGSVPMDFGAEIRDFDAKQFVRPRKALKVMCRELQTAFSSAQMALDQSGLDVEASAKDRLGTVYGGEMYYGPPEELVDAARHAVEIADSDEGRFTRGWGEAFPRDLMPLWMLKYLPNMGACHIGIAIGALGPNNTHVSDDISSISALIEAAMTLERGHADVMLAGGSGTRINTTRILYRGALPYAERHDPVELSSRPFAKDRTGMVGGEGAASFVMEREESARQRGVPILGHVRGWATRYSRGNGAVRGSEDAIYRAGAAALQMAGIGPQDLAFIDSGACGDPEMDRVEGRAIQRLAPDVPVSAIKSMIGHSGSGCGAIELAAAVLGLQAQTVPPTLAADQIDPACAVPLQAEPTPTEGRFVLKLSANPQGNAAAVVIERG